MSLRCLKATTLSRIGTRVLKAQQFFVAQQRWSSVSQRPGSDQLDCNCISYFVAMLTPLSVHFPGAVNSKFTSELAFEHPSTHAAMPTYRFMDSDGTIVDESREPSDISNEEVLTWYKDMLTGTAIHPGRTCDSDQSC